jgi:hypothetical protein
MKFYLRTAFGDSDNFFSSLDLPFDFQGSCQGNKGAPAFCLATLAFLVIMLHRLGHVAQIRAAMSLTLFITAGFLFVDDTDLFAIASSPTESSSDVNARMQQAVNAWHGGLHATGGALVPEKCSWCLVDFGWDRGSWYYRTSATLAGSLTIPVPSGAPVPITRHEPSDAIRVVGVIQALDGNMTQQIAVLKAKATTWGEQIRDGWVPRNLARKAIDSMIWPSLRYPLTACTLTEAQGAEITQTLYKYALPSLGACRNFPLAYRYAPTSLQGLALPHPYFEQGIQQICLILTHGAIDSPTGSLLRASLEQAQLEIGISTPFLSESFDTYGFLLTDCLWSSIWQFISTHNISLTYPEQVLPKP